MSATSWPHRTARHGLRPVRNDLEVIRMSDYRRRPTVEHAPDRIWGSPRGRVITCTCGVQLPPTWEPVIDVMTAHRDSNSDGAA